MAVVSRLQIYVYIFNMLVLVLFIWKGISCQVTHWSSIIYGELSSSSPKILWFMCKKLFLEIKLKIDLYIIYNENNVSVLWFFCWSISIYKLLVDTSPHMWLACYMAERVAFIFGYYRHGAWMFGWSFKHLSKSNWRPKYYWKYTWNFLEKTWKNHGNIMEFCQSGNVGTLFILTTENVSSGAQCCCCAGTVSSVNA